MNDNRSVFVFRSALILSVLCLLAVLVFLFAGLIQQAGPFCIACLATLAIGCRGYPYLKGFAYTITIFAAVTTALYYPSYFVQWNGFKLARLITPLIQLIMFGMGTSMGLKDFAGVIRTPRGVFIGVVSHFIIMPLIGFTLAKLSGLPPEIAAGIILIGCSPNGMASNVISYLAKANLALSITITAVSTLLAPFVTPFLMKGLAGAFVKINALNMMWDIFKMVIIPIGAGVLVNKMFSGRARWMDTVMPLVSMFGIAFIIVIITAAGRDSLLTIGPLLVLFVLIHNLAGYTLGYWTGRLFRMEERDCRTMAIEVGMQNGGLASGLAKEMGKMATVGLAPAIFGPLMNVTGSILASWWHRKPAKTTHMIKIGSVLSTLALLVGMQLSLSAQPAPVPDSPSSSKPFLSVTRHSVKIEGKLIGYTATAGTLVLKNEKDESIALFGFTAYTKDGETDATKRPLTFAYNGGPGSSSMWLHLGALGPRRIPISDPGLTPPPPYKMEDNEHSIIDVTDLVMIDPIGTGLSHPIGKATGKDFWGVDQDIKSIAQFIKQYITDNERWNSPKFLLGESYGTMRSAGLVSYLLDNSGIQINGVVLVSSVLDLHSLTFQDDISYIDYLPTYAATAWYHNKVPNKPASLENFLKEVRTFSLGEYASALVRGDQLSDGEKDQLLTKLAGYTGLSKDYWSKANLRVTEPAFTQELLRESHETVGRLDSRFKGINQDPLSQFSNDDPQSTQISPPYIASFMSYYYTELKVSKALEYHVSAYSTEGFKWDWAHSTNGGPGFPVTPNTGVDLANAMSKNPNLKILVLNGYYDLATPFYGTELTFDHLGLEKKVKGNVSFKYYEAGHMMYIHPASLLAFKKNVAEFILGTGK